ncbi:MAG: serine/threonine protein phosphatase [Proteobacteria bacterium]|nr:MAG: serine/threonine protein phosphatase [Pseudomonadota bacterium]PIE40189.1 MAG: serine/threonine protein phosphatase [Gammaproteobacteria bacterium]
MKKRGYDLIGDVHGCANSLIRLLDRLGYSKKNGVFEHPHRRAVFVGDIIDRGPRIREALHLVRDMVERGSAQVIMGNHEYNALGYCTRARPGSERTYLREHTDRHARMLKETLDQFEHHPVDWQDFICWFYTLPLFLEFDCFRIVHACWDETLISRYKSQFRRNTIDEDFLHASVVNGSFAGLVMNRLLRGTDLRLPDGEKIMGQDGIERSVFRTRFWADNPQTYNDVVFQPDPLPESVAQRPISEQDRKCLLAYPPGQLPVFVGHYWMSGTPGPLKPNVACLDYSAVKYGKLAAYRMDEERVLSADKFVWIEVDRELCTREITGR